jgi:hypothetical protein
VVHDDDVYNVDFVRKGYLEEEPPSSSSSHHDDDGNGNRHGIGGMTSADMEVRSSPHHIRECPSDLCAPQISRNLPYFSRFLWSPPTYGPNNIL